MMSVLKMKKNKNGGTIINISSISGELGLSQTTRLIFPLNLV